VQCISKAGILSDKVKAMAKQTNNNIEAAVTRSLKTFRKEINADFKRETGVLYEKFKDDVQLIAEKQDETTKQVSQLQGKVEMLIETVGEIKVDVTEIKDNLKRKVDVKDHKALENRVIALEVKA